MISTYTFVLLIIHLVHLSYSLQTNYTCESSIKLTCPKSQTMVILEVTYSTECTEVTSIYAPSHCIGYYRERISNQCNGKEICTVDNNSEQRPSFLIGKQANCAFQGQSINIEYSCIPDFYEDQLPIIDICSSEMIEDIKEGFIYSPNYPDMYPNNVTCTKTIPTPETRNRMKIYAMDFDIESIRVNRLNGKTQINDWLEINDNGEKFYGTRAPFTLLFDDVIEASLTFKSDSSNIKKAYHGFLLYFIITPIRRSRPTTTTTEESTVAVDAKTAALLTNKPRGKQSNGALILLVVLLSSLLLIMVVGFLLYKRRNDRRVRYLAETFHSLIPKQSKTMIVDSFDESSKTKSDPPSYKFDNPDHIYSEDPLDTKDIENALLYEHIDYETINEQLKSNEKKA